MESSQRRRKAEQSTDKWPVVCTASPGLHRSDSTGEIGAVQGKKDGHKVAAEHSFPGDALACSLWKVAHCWGGTSIAGA